MSYIKDNEKIWDERSNNDDIWSVPVTTEIINNAKKGEVSILLTPTKSVPKSWFPENLAEKKFCVWQVEADNKAQLWLQRELR